MAKRIFYIIIGVSLIGAVIALGFATSNNSAYVIWFGLAAALLAPGGIAIIVYALNANDREVIQRLSKVPQIEKLIVEAQSQEEKIRALEEEREKLASVVQFEAKRQILINKKQGLEEQAIHTLGSLDEVEKNITDLGVDVENSGLVKDVEALRERIKHMEREKVTLDLGFKKIEIDTIRLRRTPAGEVIYGYIVLMEAADKFIKKVFKRS